MKFRLDSADGKSVVRQPFDGGEHAEAPPALRWKNRTYLIDHTDFAKPTDPVAIYREIAVHNLED